MESPSTISIKLDGVEIRDRVLYDQSSFQSQANPIQGSFHLTCRDPDQDFHPQIGSKVSCHIDGIPMFGGYVMRIGRGNFFPAMKTSPVDAMKSRKWILEGPDYNVLFDKRVLHNPANFASALSVPSGHRTVRKAFLYLMDNFIDVPSGLDYHSDIDYIDTEYGTEENGGLYVGQGKTLRFQMDDFADNGFCVYYIDADFSVHMHEYEQIIMPWIFSDVKTKNAVRFREGEYQEDFTRVVTDALVWGGSTIRKPDGPAGEIVFARYPQAPANTEFWYGRKHPAWREQQALDRRTQYGRWQYGEEHAGEPNYLTLGSVKNRAFGIINGPPGEVPTNGIETGFSAPLKMMNLAWFAHDVPGKEHVRPGYLANFVLYTQGTPSNPLITTLPCRSMRISFPTIPTDNPGHDKTYVRFEGEFGTSYSDSRHMWKFLRRLGNRAPAVTREILGAGSEVTATETTPESTATTVFTAGLDGGGVAPGSLVEVAPLEMADGVRTTFTYPYSLYVGQFDLYVNGLFQRPSIDYVYNSATRQVTFLTPLGIGDQQHVSGLVSE